MVKSIQKKSKATKKQSFSIHTKAKQLLRIFLFLCFAISVVFISFLGQKNEGKKLILKEEAKERIVADFNFEYESQITAEAIAKRIRTKTPPIYIRSDEPLIQFESFLNALENAYTRYQLKKEGLSNNEDSSSLEEFLNEVIASSDYEMDPQIIYQLYQETSPKERYKLFEDGIEILNLLYLDGIYKKTSEQEFKVSTIILQIKDSEDSSTQSEARTVEDALIQLKMKTNTLFRDQALSQLSFELLKNGMKANLIFGEKETESAITKAIESIQTPILKFKQGDTIIRPGQIISPLEIETYKAYKAKELELKGDSLFFNELFRERFYLSFILFLTLYLFIKYEINTFKSKNTVLGVCATALLLNIILFRIIMEFGELLFQNNASLTALLPNLLPIALAPILISVLVGRLPAILTALIISSLFSLGFDHSLDLMLITFLPSIVGVFASYKIRNRSKLIRAGFLTGVSLALGYAILFFLNESSIALITQRMICSILIGLITGVTAVGLLPVFEQFFKISTSITLLELTDFNHPLLRKMQFEAPGTYHHSLMVANLSENAADLIGANPLLCRVCCLFHDIGKLKKPEYFSENQRGYNPHDEKNPSMSALVIKSHVKEGVTIAKNEQLPKVIIDVIKQHHGTSLIKYFYHQAKKKHTQEYIEGLKDPQNLSDLDLEESNYRYDGPKPKFKESAIIFFADAVEAASRSLKKVSQPAIEEMIDAIFESRIQDGQLDECPLTFKELNQIKSSFTRTLLNMLHSRIEYPSDSEIKGTA